MTDLAESFLDQLPDTPAGDEARWMFHQVSTRGSELTEAEFRSRIGWTEPDGSDPVLEAFRERLGNQWEQLGGRFDYEGILTAEPHELKVVLLDGGRRSEYVVAVSPDRPRTISGAT